MLLKCTYAPKYVKDELYFGTIYETIGIQEDDKYKIKNDKGEIKKYNKFYFIELREGVIYE